MGVTPARWVRDVIQEAAVTQLCLKGCIAMIREGTVGNTNVSGPGGGREACRA